MQNPTPTLQADRGAATGRSPSTDRLAAATRSVHLGDFTADRRVLTLMLMAVVVGIGGVVAAWVLTRLIYICTNFAYHGTFSDVPVDFAALDLGPLSILIPVVGGLLIGLMARFGSEKIRGHGIPEAIEAILFGKSRMDPKIAVLKPLSSAISIGSGGPFGAEGPIIMTGGAIGSLFAQMFHLSAAERKTLLVAGAAAGMTAIFGTPIAAVLLAIELLLFEWKPRSFLPVTVAVLVSAMLRSLAIDAGPLFPVAATVGVTWPHFAAGIGIGLIGGLGAGLLTLALYGVEDLFGKLPVHWMWWPAIGGVVVGIGGLVDPTALSVGYVNIRHMLQGDMMLQAAALLLVVKGVVWIVALGSGTSGGVLAPLLMIGGALGYLLGAVIPGIDPAFGALLGMSAMMAGAMRAPLTSALFAMELTGNFTALVPLLAACGCGYAVTVLLLKRSILTEKIARRGHHILQEYGIDPFDVVRAKDIMTATVETLPGTMPVKEALAFFGRAGSVHKGYPVVDAGGRVIGIMTRADALSWADDADLATCPLSEALSDAGLVVGHPQDLVAQLADRMMESDTGRIPIIDPASGKLLGLVSRRDLLRARAQGRLAERDRAAYLLRRDVEQVRVPSELGR
ncbi:MAG: CBS domain-containing protein [Rhodospirillaceae bacterium]|nr:MAG: CBS domain-containing protein [Rhodospirillaceae bacterium]